MNYAYYPSAGYLEIETELRQIGPDSYRREIVAAKLQGISLVPIGRDVIEMLPAIARHGDSLICIGQYILRRTDDFHAPLNAYYWTVDDYGECYLSLWRLMCGLEWIGRSVLLTMAVWGLANWPRCGSTPKWADVVERWKGKGA